MDFDSIIPFLFLMAFFILPGILKRFKAIKAKNATPGQVSKKPSIFDKIGEKIQKFVRELEQQAKQQKQADNKQSSAWDELAEDEDSSFEFETYDQEDDSAGTPELKKSEPLIPAEDISISRAAIKKSEKAIKKSLIGKNLIIQPLVSSKYVFKSNPLQNAVIWTEILGKPVALKR